MHRLSPIELKLLNALDCKPHGHSELSPEERAVVRGLWVNRFIRLRSADDTWVIAAKGRMLLEAGGLIH